MKRIFKYSVNVKSLPKNAKVLFGNIQDAKFYIWVEVDDEENEEELFDCNVYGTGQPIYSDSYSYLNSIIDGAFVWHFYYKVI